MADLRSTNEHLATIVSMLEHQEDKARQDRRTIAQELAAISKRVNDFWMADGVREMSHSGVGDYEKSEGTNAPAVEVSKEPNKINGEIENERLQRTENNNLNLNQEDMVAVTLMMNKFMLKVLDVESKLKNSDTVIEKLAEDLRESEARVQVLESLNKISEEVRTEECCQQMSTHEERLKHLEATLRKMMEADLEQTSNIESLLVAKLKKLEDQMEALEASCDEANRNNEASEIKFKALEARLDRFETQLESLDKTHVEVKSKKDRQQPDKEVVELLQTAQRKLVADLDLKCEFQKINPETSGGTAPLSHSDERRVKVLEVALRKLEFDFKQLRDRGDDDLSVSKWEQLTDRLKALDAKYIEAMNTIKDSDTKIEQIKTRMDRSEAKVGQVQAEMRNTEAAISLFENKLAWSQIDDAKIRKKVDQHELSITKMKLELDSNQPRADPGTLNQLPAKPVTSSQTKTYENVGAIRKQQLIQKAPGSPVAQSPSPPLAPKTYTEKQKQEVNDDLWNASMNGDIEGMMSALSSGADLEHRTQNYSPLDIATFHGQTSAVEYLLEVGASVHRQQSKGWSTLHFAAWKGHCTIAEMLIKYGADKEVKDAYDRTPLIVASYYGHADTVRILLDNGADMSVRNAGGRTALECAGKSGGDVDGVIKVLKEFEI